jgi:hypothetical protein
MLAPELQQALLDDGFANLFLSKLRSSCMDVRLGRWAKEQFDLFCRFW